ncbi:MAG TPA: MBL fold metallo-hydrolase [Spirochaetia bacterium]|nr:MBL fold metallo-hydrolase [Spirochaetia bacterium]
MIDRLRVLGSGTIIPSKGHGCAGYLLEGSDAPLLIDCGPGTLCRLTEAGVMPDSIGLIIISHFHLDHISDLPAILNARSILCGGKRKWIKIVGPSGLKRYMSWLGEWMDPWFADYQLDLVEIGNSDHETDGLRLQSHLTGHTENSVCFRISQGGEVSFFYSGDTDYNEQLVPLARHSDLALFECSMPEDRKLHGHLTPRLAAILANMAEVQQLVLTHFYQENLATDIAAEASKCYGGPVFLASDLTSYPIRRSTP